MRHLGRRAATLCLVGLVAGCGGAVEEAPAAEETSASGSQSQSDSESEDESAEAGTASCADLLSDEQAAELVGSDVGTAEEGRAGQLPACQWGSPSAGVQVLHLPADEWIAQLPALIDALESSGLDISPDQQRRLDEGLALIEEGADAGEACETFSTLAEIQGTPPGSDSVTNIFPNRQQPEVVSAQACADGRFVSVTFGSPQLGEDLEGAVAAAEDTLSTVQQNAGP